MNVVGEISLGSFSLCLSMSGIVNAFALMVLPLAKEQLNTNIRIFKTLARASILLSSVAP